MNIPITNFEVDDDRLADGDYIVQFICGSPFTDSEGVERPLGSVQEFEATATAGRLTAPDVEISTTTDAIVNQRSFYNVKICKTNASRTVVIDLAQGIVVPWTIAPSYSWSELRLFGAAQMPGRDATHYTKTEANQAIDLKFSQFSTPDASTAVKGKTKLSVAPVSASNPVAVGDNDPRVSAVVNVRAAEFDAPADGIADATAEIQAAIDSVNGTAGGNGTVFLPFGRYKISAPLVATKGVVFRGVGAQPGAGGHYGTKIFGDFADFLIRYELDVGGTYGACGVEDIWLVNNTSNGGGIFIQQTSPSTRFAHIAIDAWKGIRLNENCFTVLIMDADINGFANAAGGYGVYVAGHATLISLDVVGHETGLRLNGPGVAVVGGRYEVNKRGIVIGEAEDGSIGLSGGFTLSGFYCEANDEAVIIRNANGYRVSNGSIFGSVNSPSAQSQYGLRVESEGSGTIEGISLSGGHSRAAIKAKGFASFKRVIGGTNTLGPVWDVAEPHTATFEGTDFPLIEGGTSPSLMAPFTAMRALGAADAYRGTKQGKNLRAFNLPVSAGATFLDVAFPQNVSGGAASINAITAVVDGASTLAPGSYVYAASIVNELGESGAVEKTVTVAAGQRVDLTFFGGSTFGTNNKNWRRRIYRGTSPGVYTGYFDHAAESSATFSDVGQAFTGKRTPQTGDGASGTEPDANYAVSVAPAWLTTYSVTNKATTGFRVNFGTAPGADSTLDWMLIR